MDDRTRDLLWDLRQFNVIHTADESDARLARELQRLGYATVEPDSLAHPDGTQVPCWRMTITPLGRSRDASHV